MILGGDNNRIGTNCASAITVGGTNNLVADNCGLSFAAGRRCRVNHVGAFMWADSQNASFSSAGVNTFNVRAEGGVHWNEGHLPVFRIFHTPDAQFVGGPIRDRGSKFHTLQPDRPEREFLMVPRGRALQQRELPWSGWRGDDAAQFGGAAGQRDVRQRLRPQRQGELHRASIRRRCWRPGGRHADLGVELQAGPRCAASRAHGSGLPRGVRRRAWTTEHIATVDADGVALAAIQGLNRKDRGTGAVAEGA
jgi:hypothetical protein